MQHRKDRVPPELGSVNHFYRRSVDVPKDNITIESAMSAAVSGQTVNVEPPNPPTPYICNLTSNITINSGRTLKIMNYATVNLYTKSIQMNGGNLIVENYGTLSGVKAHLKTGSTLRWYCGLIQTACNYAVSNDSVIVQNGSFSENISTSGKNGLKFYGKGTGLSNIIGTLSFSNSSSLRFAKFTSSGLTLNYCTSPLLDHVNIQSTGSGQLYAYNSSGVSIIASVHNAGSGFASFSSTCSAFSGSYFTDNLTAVNSAYGSNVLLYKNINPIELCGSSNYHLYAVNNGYLNAVGCAYDNGIPVIYEGSGGNIDITATYSCGAPKISVNAMNDNLNNITYYSINQNSSSALDAFRIINNQYFDIFAKMNTDLETNGYFESGKYNTELKGVITEYKDFIKFYPDIPLAKTSLTTAVHCFKQMADNEGMKIFLQEILADEKLTGLKGLGKRFMIDYYIADNDLGQALATADEVLEEYKRDAALTCDVLYAKGLIYAYNLNDSTKAAECFTNIINSHPEQQLADIASNQLQSLGYETEKGTVETTVLDNPEFSISNYPNPFNPVTTISYKLAEAGQVKLQVFDLLGRLVATIVNESKPVGCYIAHWNGSHLSSGTYFLRLRITDNIQNVVFDKTKKMLLTK